MTSIAILVSVCSRNETYETFDDIPFLARLFPSFEKTKSEGFKYTFFIGYDDDDEYYKKNSKKLEAYGKVYELTECQHAPAYAWNKLATKAYDENYDYLFQIGDDVVLDTPGWTEVFVSELEKHNNIGVVGPCNLVNYYGRLESNNHFVIENSFVHRKHIEIFGSFFHAKIPNWFCDDWITLVYKGIYSECIIDKTCNNRWVAPRYEVKHCPEIKTYVEEGRELLFKHV